MIHTQKFHPLKLFSLLSVACGLSASFAQAGNFSLPQDLTTVVSYENGKWSNHASANPSANLVLRTLIRAENLEDQILTFTPEHRCLREVQISRDATGCELYAPEISGYGVSNAKPFFAFGALATISASDGEVKTPYILVRNEQEQYFPAAMGESATKPLPETLNTFFSEHGAGLSGDRQSGTVKFQGKTLSYDVTVKCPSYTRLAWTKEGNHYLATAGYVPPTSGLNPSGTYASVSACMVQWTLNGLSGFGVSQIFKASK